MARKRVTIGGALAWVVFLGLLWGPSAWAADGVKPGFLPPADIEEIPADRLASTGADTPGPPAPSASGALASDAARVAVGPVAVKAPPPISIEPIKRAVRKRLPGFLRFFVDLFRRIFRRPPANEVYVPGWETDLTMGRDCYREVLDPRATGHDPENVYLFILASYYFQGSDPAVSTRGDFRPGFERVFRPWGLDRFDMIDLMKGTADTQVMVMSNERAVIVVFRGSEKTWGGTVSPGKFVHDWILTDLNIRKVSMPAAGPGTKVHRGIWKALDVVYPQLRALIDAHQAGRKLPLWITGHSLGGGLATLSALRLVRDGVAVQGVVSFGSPRVGNSKFVRAFRDSIKVNHRWVNDRDIIARVPPVLLGFRHVCKPHNINHNGKIELNDGEWLTFVKVGSHHAINYLDRLYEALPAASRALVPAPPGRAARPVRDPRLVEEERQLETGFAGNDTVTRDDDD